MHRFFRHSARCLSGVALSLSIAVSAPAFAEDGTSGSEPTPTTTCELVASTWSNDPGATPVAATPVATPIADTEAELQKDAKTSIEAILACMSNNDSESLIKVTSPEFRGQWLGIGGPVSDADLPALLSMLPALPYQLIEIQNPVVEDTQLSTTVVYTVGRQVLTADWTLHQQTVDGQRLWVVQGESLMPTVKPENASILNIAISDEGYTFTPTEVTGAEISIVVANSGANPHEVLILRTPPGMTAGEIAAAPTGIPNGATFIGQATVPAGESGTMVLTNVRPGTYTVVDLLPDANGIPNVSNGMIGTFEVKAP